MSLRERDKKHLWHPLVQHKLYPEMLPIVSAKGASFWDESGKEYIDGISSWYTVMYGHCNPFILEEVREQMTILDQVVFAGFTHPPAIELSEALKEILPTNQQKIFFSDNGSTAVEIGIKMALQYHHNKGQKRSVLVALENGFHGDTFGAMSVSGLSVYNGPFEEHFIEVKRIPVPVGANNEQVLACLQKLLEKDRMAGFIYEPLVQGAAGMVMYDGEGLDALLQLCRQHDVITIADEVMTGFGKTGTFFASDQIAVKPDIICLSKALTAGLVPMGITSCTQHIYDAFYRDDINKGLFHAHTYSANPLACTTALAGITLLHSTAMQENIRRISQAHKAFCARIAQHPKAVNVRCKGVILALEIGVPMTRYGSLRDKMYHFFMERGVFLRPLGNTLYTVPPYVTTDKQLEKIYNLIEQALDRFGSNIDRCRHK